MNKAHFFFITYFNLIIIVISLNGLKSEEFHSELLNKLDETFPAEIYFSQTDSDNITSKGWMVIAKKGLARVEFEPPNQFIMVADGNWLIVHDAQYDRTSYLPLDGGILGALLYPEKFQEINQLKVTKNNNSYYSLVSKNFDSTELRVFFDKKYKALKGWDIIENKSISISVRILKIKKIKNLQLMNKNIFKFPEFMRASKEGFLGPYERKIRKLPTGRTN